MASYYLKSPGGSIGSGSYLGYWSATQSFATGDRVVCTRSAATSARRYIYECTSAGTSGGSEPTWDDTPGNQTTDSGVTWTCRASTTWANAHFVLDYIAGISAADDVFYLAHTYDYTETASNATASWYSGTGYMENPVRVLCVDATGFPEPPTALATGAKWTYGSSSGSGYMTTGDNFVYWYGIEFAFGSGGSNGNIYFNGKYQHLENCKFTTSGTGSSHDFFFRGSLLKNCTFKFGHINNGIVPTVSSTITIEGGGLDPTSAAITDLFKEVGACSNVRVINADLSAMSSTGTIFSTTITGLYDALINCKLPSGWSGNLVGSPTNAIYVATFNCDSGNTNYKFLNVQKNGSIEADTTYYRTGGASDGDTNISWKFSTNSNSNWFENVMESPSVEIWNDDTGSPITVTVEILHDSTTALTNQDIWLDVSYLGSAVNTQGTTVSDSSASRFFEAPVTQDSSAETWNGSMTNPNKQKLSVTITPQKKGVISGIVRVAKPSYVVYVDPVLTLS